MRRPLNHWLLLFALVAMWGSSFLLTKVAVRGFTPATLVTLRIILAAILLTGFALLSRRRFPANGKFWLFSLMLAVCGNSLPFWLTSFGQQEVASGLAGIFMGIIPVTTMVLAHFFVPGERLSPAKAVGFLLGFAGLIVLIGPDALLELQGHGTALLYELAILGAAICFAVNNIVARHRPRADALVAAAGMMLAGSLIMAPLGLPPLPVELGTASTSALIAAIALGVMSTAVATVVFLKLVSTAGPSFASFISYLIPVWAVLLGAVALGERLEARSLLALLLILGGIGLSEMGARRMMAAAASDRG